jgi:hydroxyacylglutathione hydrolase
MKITDNIYIVGGSSFGLSHEFDGNIYIIDCKNKLIMIDTGAGLGINIVLENIKNDGLDINNLSKIFLTHSHIDHSGGAYELKSKYNCDVFVSEKEADFIEFGNEKDFALDVAKRSGFYSKEYQFKHCKVSTRVKHNDEIKCGSFVFKILNIPGHSKGSIALVADFLKGKAIFSGDIVSAEGTICYLNCKGSELSDYRSYIHRLANLGIDMIFPGHGVFTLSDGQKYLDKAIDELRLLTPPRTLT